LCWASNSNGKLLQFSFEMRHKNFGAIFIFWPGKTLRRIPCLTTGMHVAEKQ
jgi:hypothetical protein